jgi:hypothetical protein
MQLKLGSHAEKIIEEQLRTKRFQDAESVVLAGLTSLAAQGVDEFAPGELQSLLAEGEASIAAEGTLDGDEASSSRMVVGALTTRHPINTQPSVIRLTQSPVIG